MLNLLKKLCSLNGVSSYEDEVRDYIRNYASKYTDNIREDTMGNLLVYKKGKRKIGQTVMLAAHMDEVGLIVRAITDEGYLKFAFVGGVDRRVTIGQRVFIGKDRVPGIIGIKAYHLVTKDEEKKVPKVDEMYIDIGAETKENAEKLTFLGDFGAFDGTTSEFGDGYFKAKAIDDRIGCAVMLKLLEKELPFDTWFAFTVQEEVGTRGAFGAAFSITPDIAIVLEGTTAADIPEMEEHKKVCSPGKGAVIPFMDGGTIYDRELFEMLRETAVKNNIPWQTKQFISGGTDASAIQKTKEGVKVCAISAALRYIHSPSSVGSISDFEAVYNLAWAALNSLGGQIL